MRKSRFSGEQIIRILGRVEAGELVKNVCRDIGISENTYYRWKVPGPSKCSAGKSCNCRYNTRLSSGRSVYTWVGTLVPFKGSQDRT